ncbi:hypothetical protein [Aurantiacibacter flavus]|uniref:Uncharacterized protein n=1 Tax=Aurantiacibacter flavus TaxID=3145232 RepID=A0ABV0CTT8_9SPHN
MKRTALLLAGVALACTSATFALAAPEDLLPPSFGNAPPPPPPSPAPSPSPRASSGTPAARPSTVSGPSVDTGSNSNPVVQPLPGPGEDLPVADSGRVSLPEGFPTLAELEAMEPDEIDQVLGLTPKYDIPPGARRSMEKVGVLSSAEGGFHSRSFAGQPARLVEAALEAAKGPMISRWGHILLRRVLASRLDAPEGMDPAGFAAMRASALNAMGEETVARALVQDVDGSNYNRALTDAAMESYLATGDILGMCPVARLQPLLREDGEWEMIQGLCLAYDGQVRSGERRLQKVLGTQMAPTIDVRLAQRFAGAAGEGRRAVNIEWDGVEDLTPWRFGLARALGADIPESLRRPGQQPELDIAEVQIPASPLLDRIKAADVAAERGIFSAAAMVDLYSLLYASDLYDAGAKAPARQLRAAYAAADVTQRIAAMRSLWTANPGYGSRVLTAYAAARIEPSEALADDAGELIASMLTAGLDRNAMRWSGVVEDGSLGWALLSLARPAGRAPVSAGAVESFADVSERKARFLLAGLAGLGRLSDDDARNLASNLDTSLDRTGPWRAKIERAAATDNAALVALLAGVGMQGQSWAGMTPRQLYTIVRSLDQVGLSAEARMIAAEAVARG